MLGDGGRLRPGSTPWEDGSGTGGMPGPRTPPSHAPPHTSRRAGRRGPAGQPCPSTVETLPFPPSFATSGPSLPGSAPVGDLALLTGLLLPLPVLGPPDAVAVSPAHYAWPSCGASVMTPPRPPAP